MTASPSYTAAQLRAFAWLPGDGSWRTLDLNDYVPGHMSLDSPFVESNRVFFGQQFEIQYRLTPAGIAERARLVELGVIK